MEERYIKTSEFIKNRWKDAVRIESSPDYPLPYPFIPPCVNGLFQCLFYWDTFFTNRGMILDGHTDYAKYNTDNLIYLLNKYGFVPNSNSYSGIKHCSQPPYLHFMIKDVYDTLGDKKWLKEAYFSLKKEYEFFMNERMTPIGLNRYYHHPKTKEECIDYYNYVTTRIPELDKFASEDIKAQIGSSLNCDGESGLDYTPRFNLEGEYIIPVDLNCNLYMIEGDLAYCASMFEKEKEEYYLNKQKIRLKLMNMYLLNKEDNLYYDYNFKNEKLQQTIFNFTGQFFMFISGISKDKEACLKLLKNLEYEHGVASTSKYPYKYSFQAAYPYSWPYDNYFAFEALRVLDLNDDLKRISYKYMNKIAKQYETHSYLFETTSAFTDEVIEKNEYENTEMLGWTAGVYQIMYYYLKELENK